MTKVVDNKRNHHAEKVLKNLSKKASQSSANNAEYHANSEDVETTATSASEGEETTLQKQYYIIRDDVLKLREDLNKGFDLAKKYMEPKILVQQFLKMREERAAHSN